ncbi:hypothetical protein PoB_001618200 [Plakobranchus ocellatus]|uniref:Uncharacterized protein n=1 Tax=Plakobranchus ocellatus TaxID=259542 RepID=A0AAV3Z565_9GAST|nr:hypothetical protein PoB_001618200 [Plakobranchus ocellatus]
MAEGEVKYTAGGIHTSDDVFICDLQILKKVTCRRRPGSRKLPSDDISNTHIDYTNAYYKDCQKIKCVNVLWMSPNVHFLNQDGSSYGNRAKSYSGRCPSSLVATAQPESWTSANARFSYATDPCPVVQSTQSSDGEDDTSSVGKIFLGLGAVLIVSIIVVIVVLWHRRTILHTKGKCCGANQVNHVYHSCLASNCLPCVCASDKDTEQADDAVRHEYTEIEISDETNISHPNSTHSNGTDHSSRIVLPLYDHPAEASTSKGQMYAVPDVRTKQQLQVSNVYGKLHARKSGQDEKVAGSSSAIYNTSSPTPEMREVDNKKKKSKSKGHVDDTGVYSALQSKKAQTIDTFGLETYGSASASEKWRSLRDAAKKDEYVNLRRVKGTLH